MSGRHRRHAVFVAGLTEGILSSKYLPELGKHLDEEHEISLVQVLMTSSHQGWGMGSVSRDAEEILLLMRHLKKVYGSEGVVLIGHSTGCQDTVMYAHRHRGDAAAAPLLGAVLQAPVSDREWFEMMHTTPARIQLAQRLAGQGKLKEVAFVATDLDGAPVSAQRWLSLAAKGGEEDFFSSDLSNHELQDALSGLVGLPSLLICSGDDEYVHPKVKYLEHCDRLAEAIGDTAKVEFVQGARHSLADHKEQAVALISEFAATVLKKDP